MVPIVAIERLEFSMDRVRQWFQEELLAHRTYYFFKIVAKRS
jgi:hypothetical protein